MLKSLESTDLQASAGGMAFYKQNVTMTVVTSYESYVVTINNWDALMKFKADFKADLGASANQEYSEKNLLFGTSEAAFLNMFGNAVTLFKANLNSTEYNPIILNSTNEPIVKPCP